MNNKYAYRENNVLVNTDKGIESREYVDNLDEILEVENNIETLEDEIKLFKFTLDRKNHSRKYAILLFNMIAIGSLFAGISLSTSLNGVLVFILGIAFGGSVARMVAGEDVKKKTIKKLESRISVSKFQLEQEEKTLDELKQKSKKIEIPKYNRIIDVPAIYKIDNLKHKLKIVLNFKAVPELFIDEYNNGTIEDVLGDLGSTNMIEDIKLVEYLIDEYKKEQIKRENVKGKIKNKR